MATQAQIQANRLNAEKSTGPRTADGKRKASQNALKHGLLAQTMVIAGEDVGEFEFYRDELLGELRRLRLMREVEPATEKPARADEWWGKPHPDMERPSSRVNIRLFSFSTTSFL